MFPEATSHCQTSSSGSLSGSQSV
uniref:(California timema) hypothetical protein n=1 Tax=Timema californicum TaxID=61474 RepID=A0A7R9PFE0_TIMCA|nr:unnamed protein product [Timema californicum]